MIYDCIDDYIFCGGTLIWKTEKKKKLQKLIMNVLEITNAEFKKVVMSGEAEALRILIRQRTLNLSVQELEEVCNVLTKVEGDANE